MNGQPLDIRGRCWRWGVQVSDALAACSCQGNHSPRHQARQHLRPTPSGQVKILDFRTGQHSPPPGVRSTMALQDSLTIAGVDFRAPPSTCHLNRRAAKSLIPAATCFPWEWCCTRWRPGYKPFRKNNSVTSNERACSTRSRPRRRANSILLIPEDLEGILGRAMEKDRGIVTQTALAMKGDLAVAEERDRARAHYQRTAPAGASLQAAHHHLRSTHAALAALRPAGSHCPAAHDPGARRGRTT